MPPVIETHQLTKVYESGFLGRQEVHALKDLDLTIESGEIFGYLGPNGSGKTTTIKMLLSLIFPTSGSIKIFGTENISDPQVKGRIGFLPEGAYYPDFLKGEEILRFYGQLYNLGGASLEKRIDAVMDLVGMTHARKRFLRGYSKGMRQRIGLAQAMLSDPDILILDEPTTGLDPLARREIRDILAGLRDAGKTLLISSHELSEVELISDRVGILYQGELQVCGTLDELLTDRDLTIEAENISESASDKFAAAGIQVEKGEEGKALLRIPPTQTLYEAIGLCQQEKVTVTTVAPRRETLEELFVRTVGSARKK